MTNWKYIGGFSVTFAIVGCFATWLVIGELSPFHDYFLDHVMLPNIILKQLVVPYLVVMIVKPETDFGDMLVAKVVEFMQWLLLGFLLALSINLVSSGRQTDKTKRLE